MVENDRKHISQKEGKVSDHRITTYCKQRNQTFISTGKKNTRVGERFSKEDAKSRICICYLDVSLIGTSSRWLHAKSQWCSAFTDVSHRIVAPYQGTVCLFHKALGTRPEITYLHDKWLEMTPIVVQRDDILKKDGMIWNSPLYNFICSHNRNVPVHIGFGTLRFNVALPPLLPILCKSFWQTSHGGFALRQDQQATSSRVKTMGRLRLPEITRVKMTKLHPKKFKGWTHKKKWRFGSNDASLQKKDFF